MSAGKTMGRLAAAGLALGVVLGLAAGADAQDKKIRWKMHSAFTSKLAILGSGGKRVEEQVKAMTDGNFDVRFYEPGALVPGLAYFDPLAQGAIDAAWGSAGYASGKEPALAFFTSVPFGMGPGEYLAWMRFGNGNKMLAEIYHGWGIQPNACGMLAPEASGWFRKEIKSLDDLKGLKMRFFGLGARVMEKFGVSTQLLAGGDIYPALELGSIDATEFSMPALDESIGLFQVAKHYYFPGWHQPSTILDLAVNKAKFDALPAHYRAILENACGENIVNTFAEGEAIQFGAMKRMQAKGVTIHRWSDEILGKFEAAWKEVVVEESAKSPVFKKVAEDFYKFRADYAIWKDHGYLK